MSVVVTPDGYARTKPGILLSLKVFTDIGCGTGKPIFSAALYHPFEHVAFATWVVPKLLKDKVDAGRMSAISCRFWLAYIGADLVSSVFKIRELGKRREKVVRQAQTTTLTNNEVRAESL